MVKYITGIQALNGRFLNLNFLQGKNSLQLFSCLKFTQFCMLYQSRVYDSQFSSLMWTKTNLRFYEKAHQIFNLPITRPQSLSKTFLFPSFSPSLIYNKIIYQRMHEANDFEYTSSFLTTMILVIVHLRIFTFLSTDVTVDLVFSKKNTSEVKHGMHFNVNKSHILRRSRSKKELLFSDAFQIDTTVASYKYSSLYRTWPWCVIFDFHSTFIEHYSRITEISTF